MRWTVIYRSPAQDELASIWLNAANPQEVARTADEIDRLLANNPMHVGESRERNTRIIVERPLTVLYDVFTGDALVEVFAVYYWRRGKQ
jgi:hypothetical protein